jgi:hypothetical protein
MGQAAAEKHPVIQADQKDALNYYSRYCRPLWANQDIRFDGRGDLYLLRNFPLTPAKQEGQFLEITPDSMQATLFTYKPTTYAQRVVQVVHLANGVESAIRYADQVLKNTKDVKQKQLAAITGRAQSLLEDYSLSFRMIPQEEFDAARDETIQMLHDAGLHPTRLLDQETKKISDLLVKGSYGEDSLQRRNKLISLLALSQAYDMALSKQQEIPPTIKKYTGIRSALWRERIFDREIFRGALHELSMQGVAGHTLFRHPDSPTSNTGVVIGKLNTLIFQLSQIHAKPYFTAAQQTRETLMHIQELLQKNKRHEIKANSLFESAYYTIKNTKDTSYKVYSS